jgi:hypothetical protein
VVSALFSDLADDRSQSITIRGSTAMKRIGIIGLILVAAFALNAIAASSASAFLCYQVDETGTGNRNNHECNGAVARPNEYIRIKQLTAKVGNVPGLWCAWVNETEEGNRNVANCGGGVVEKGEYILVRGVPEPRLLPPVFPMKFTASSGTGALETASTSAITCQSDSTTGEITGETKVGSVMLTFSGCHSAEKSGCTVKGGGAGSGQILTKTLEGEIGSVKTSEATSGVGLLLLPTTGTEFASVEGPCLIAETIPVDGTIAGEVTPINVSSTDSKLIFTGSAGAQKIKAISVLGTTVKPELKALGLLEASETSNELLVFEEAVTVT